MDDDRRDPAIARLDIVPDYASGFLFHWRMRGGFSDPSPWTYRVQSGLSEDGPWQDISPALTGATAWRSDGPLRVNKSDVLFFRVVCETPAGKYESCARTPYGDLDRSEFLIGRDIIRREVLHMSRMAGVECSLWSIANYGPKCPRCLDPITGHSRDNHCRLCLGTGFAPPYRGPVDMWCLFSEDNQHALKEASSGDGMVEQKTFSVRMAGAVPAKKNDVLHDRRSGKRYYVNQAQVAAELRRVPLVQTLLVSEIATTDSAYAVGEAQWPSN